MLADDFARRIALDALAPDVPAGDDARGVEHVERVVGDTLDQQAETALALEQVPLLSDILNHRDPASRLANAQIRIWFRGFDGFQAPFACNQRRSATSAQTASTRPKGQAPCRKP